MTAADHIMRIFRNLAGAPKAWRGICSCGFQTPWMKDYTQACRDCRAHEDYPHVLQLRLDVA